MLKSCALVGNRFLLAVLLILPLNEQAFAESASKAAVESAFLFNFFKFIEWPEAFAKLETVNLCTIGDNDLDESLTALENKTVAEKPLLIRRQVKIKELKSCHMVYFGEMDNLVGLLKDLKEIPVVTVSSQVDFIMHGGMIGLVQNENKLGFEINLNNAQDVGLHISARMLKVALNVSYQK